jgi:hypothetical protein
LYVSDHGPIFTDDFEVYGKRCVAPMVSEQCLL